MIASKEWVKTILNKCFKKAKEDNYFISNDALSENGGNQIKLGNDGGLFTNSGFNLVANGLLTTINTTFTIDLPSGTYSNYILFAGDNHYNSLANTDIYNIGIGTSNTSKGSIIKVAGNAASITVTLANKDSNGNAKLTITSSSYSAYFLYKLG